MSSVRAAGPRPRCPGRAGTEASPAIRNSGPDRAAVSSSSTTGEGSRLMLTTHGSDPSGRCSHSLHALGQAHVLGVRVVRRREVAPRQRSLLPIGLAERHREACPREFFPEIERVRRLVDVELREDICDALRPGAADEALVVEDRDPFAVGEDAEVRIGDLRLKRPQFFLCIRQDLRIFDGDQAIVDALWESCAR